MSKEQAFPCLESTEAKAKAMREQPTIRLGCQPTSFILIPHLSKLR